MKTVGAFKAKTHLSQLLREVEINSEEIFIQKHNRTVACLVPCSSPDMRNSRGVDVLAGFKEIREKAAASTLKIKELITEGRKR